MKGIYKSLGPIFLLTGVQLAHSDPFYADASASLGSQYKSAGGYGKSSANAALGTLADGAMGQSDLSTGTISAYAVGPSGNIGTADMFETINSIATGTDYFGYNGGHMAVVATGQSVAYVTEQYSISTASSFYQITQRYTIEPASYPFPPPEVTTYYGSILSETLGASGNVISSNTTTLNAWTSVFTPFKLNVTAGEKISMYQVVTAEDGQNQGVASANIDPTWGLTSTGGYTTASGIPVPAETPEPASFLVLGVPLAGLLVRRRSARRA